MTTDIDLRQVRELESILQQHMDLFGYDLIDVPMIADADIFLTRAGNTIIQELFTFERFGRLLALRPEFTAAAAHRYTRADHDTPVRWQVSGSIFIDEPSDISMQYQQHTIGAELIGQAGTLADSEMVAMAVQGINKIGFVDWELVIGHVGLQLHLLSQFELDSRTYRILMTQRDRLKQDGKAAVLDYLNEILNVDENTSQSTGSSTETEQVLDMLLDSTRYSDTMGGRTRHDIASRLLKKHDRGLEHQTISDALDFLKAWGQIRGTLTEVQSVIQAFIAEDDSQGQAIFDNWLETLQLLDAYGISEDQMIIQPDLTKNWDYYTGLVFGIRAKDRYIASGGRYDGLTQLIGGGDSTPAVGFAYFTQLLIETVGQLPRQANVFRLGGDIAFTIQWAAVLREAGIAIVLTDQDADIVIEGNQAQYQNQTYSLIDLLKELIQ